MATVVKENLITLQGSAQIVCEFFDYSINSILYQRGVYPPETFTRMQKYGLTLLVTDDDQLKEYLTNVMLHMKDLLAKNVVRRVVLAIADVATKAVMEKWEFRINCCTDSKTGAETTTSDKSMEEIQAEIRAIIRQIVASVTYLPLIETACAFDVLIYTSKDTEVEEEIWKDSVPPLIPGGGQEVRLKSFSTKIHSVEAAVTYR